MLISKQEKKRKKKGSTVHAVETRVVGLATWGGGGARATCPWSPYLGRRRRRSQSMGSSRTKEGGVRVKPPAGLICRPRGPLGWDEDRTGLGRWTLKPSPVLGLVYSYPVRYFCIVVYSVVGVGSERPTRSGLAMRREGGLAWLGLVQDGNAIRSSCPHPFIPVPSPSPFVPPRDPNPVWP
ncbi:hypothetical protein LZ31DRAFT_168945 [Colletotrichum somersetense]|nr:hypothetical protein LZ31DRAFT_168945 [Colletotrichum somersetense]